MSEQDAIERVAKAIHETGIQVVATERTPWPMRSVTAAAIQEYNAYLRERAQDADVVKAAAGVIERYPSPHGGTQQDYAQAALTAALDAILGKENDDDR